MAKNLIIAALAIALLVLGYLWYTNNQPTPVPQAQTQETEEESGVVCAQVVTPARDPDTGNIKEFPTPCDVPKNWEVIQNDVPGLELEVQ